MLYVRFASQALLTCVSSLRIVNTLCWPRGSFTCWVGRDPAPLHLPNTSASSTTGWSWRTQQSEQVCTSLILSVCVVDVCWKQPHTCVFIILWKEGRTFLFSDALNIFYLRLYGVRHMVKDHSDSEKGNLLPTYGLQRVLLCALPTDRITHTTAFVTPIVEHWLKWEIAQWVIILWYLLLISEVTVAN